MAALQNVERNIRKIMAEAELSGDLRRYQRTIIPLTARYLLPDGIEREGQITDISPGGAFLAVETNAAVGDPITMQIDEIGQVSGKVARVAHDGLGVAFQTRRARAVRIADTLTWLINGGDKMNERRTAIRFQMERPAQLVLASGQVSACRVMDISTSGASVEVEGDLPVQGEKVWLGRQHAQVVRVENKNVGLAFAQDDPVER